MARSRAAARGLPLVLAALAGSAGWGWHAAGRAAATFHATVVEVVDGDTFVVRYANGRRDTVRMLGVDAPETVHPDRPVECFGPEARAYTTARLAGRAVVLETDTESRDAYGRLLASVRVGGERVEDELLRRGLARFLVIAPNTRRARALLAAELDARGARRGLWGACA